MIPRTATLFQPKSWKKILSESISQPIELLRELNLENTSLASELDTSPHFRLRVPRGFVAKMKKGDPKGPLLLQVLPLAKENIELPGYLSDPVGDLESEVVPGVLHKYNRRALLVTTGACGIHCRYCFRRHFPYGDSNPAAGQWQSALDYISKTKSINEVLLSGGDPLSLSDEKLTDLVEQIEAIPHVKRLRIHTRMPVILPERINDDFLQLMSSTRLQTVIVIHANHANEIDQTVGDAMALLTERGVTLLNQSVLLRDVNNHVDALDELSEALFAVGVLPYYLHLLDPVQGAAHFNVQRDEALTIMVELRERLAGYLVPKLVWEKPGALSKLPIS